MTQPTNHKPMSKTTTDSASSMLYMRPMTKRINWLIKNLPNPEDQREYARDRCVVAFSEALGEIIHDAKMSRGDLAAKLGKQPSQISRLLNGGHNMTLRTLADLLWACDMEVVDPSLGFGPLGVIEVSTADADAWETVNMDEWTTVVRQAVAS